MRLRWLACHQTLLNDLRAAERGGAGKGRIFSDVPVKRLVTSLEAGVFDAGCW